MDVGIRKKHQKHILTKAPIIRLMPNAVTHILIPIILIDLIRDYKLKNKRILTNKHILLCGIGGILPDMDVAFGLVMTILTGSSPMAFHRTYTHSLFAPLLLLIITAILHYKNKKEPFKISLMITIGYIIHLFLDAILIDSIMPFYPLSTAKWGLNIITGDEFGTTLMLGLDTVILLAWLIHEQIKHKIIDYI